MTPGPPAPESVDEVLDRLDRIVDEARQAGSRAGYFAALYRRVTRRIAAGIEAGRFEDADRMERFDVLFARRYLDAVIRYRSDQAVPTCWFLSFRTDEGASHLILQHILLGMNAHINFDLPLAAVETTGAKTLPDLREDFFEVTGILVEMLDEVQEDIGTVSPWLWLADLVGERSDEEIFSFVLSRAREFAWASALRLSQTPDVGREAYLDRADRRVTEIGRGVRDPGGLIRPVLALIRAREPNDAARVIETLVD